MNKYSTTYTYLLIVFISLLLFGIGGGVGYYFTVKEFRTKILKHTKAEILGNLLTESEKHDWAQAYYEPLKTVQEINNYCWSVPTVVSPFVGHGCRPGQQHNAVINSKQFRANKELMMPKPHNIYRIFITGGSTVFSSGAPNQDSTIGSYLSQILNEKLAEYRKLHYEVWVMATPAWASTHERIIIENRLSEFEPDLIVSFSGNNDVHWGFMGRNILWFRSYSDEFYWDMIQKIYKMSGFRPLPDVVSVASSPIPPAIVSARLVKNIQLSAYALSLKNIQYIFCLQPILAVTQKALSTRESNYKNKRISHQKENYFRECYLAIDTHLKEITLQNFQYINLAKIFNDMNKNEELFLDSYHFGDKGNHIIAEQIYHHIKDIILLQILEK